MERNQEKRKIIEQILEQLKDDENRLNHKYVASKDPSLLNHRFSKNKTFFSDRLSVRFLRLL